MTAISILSGLGTVLALIYLVEWRAGAGRAVVLDRLGRLLGARPANDAVSGTLRGEPLTFRFTHRGHGRVRQAWTELDVAVPPGGLSLALRVETMMARVLRDRGMYVDVQTGDARFDARFIVEAAPAHLARAFLDAKLRAALLEAWPVEVSSIDGHLRVAATGHVRRTRAIELAYLAARLGAAYRASAAGENAPYRAAPQASGDELTRLAEVQRRRGRLANLLVVGLTIVWTVLVVARLATTILR